MKRQLITLLLGAFFFVLTGAPGCEPGTEGTKADQLEAQRTQQAAAQAADVAGFPAITRFTEKERLRRIYELRDDPNLTTYTYTFAQNTGQLRLLCESIGFGVPFSAQFSNPVRSLDDKSWDGSDTVLPQPEPNGIFPPTSSDATFVICVEGGREQVVYAEPTLIVSPFPLE